MHTFSETGAGVPAFLAKLWRLVDDPDTNNLICWSKDGRSFIIQNQAQFARELLPLNYKHNNMASFIRQLNMYGFHKITSIDNGGLKFDRDEMEFSHPCFKRNCPYLLEHIKRKIANTKSLDEKASGIKPEAVSKVLQDVKAMRGRQDSLDSRFSVMKQENETLWREIASLRQKHAKQQQIVNKLIQFLITIVQPSRNLTSVKRHIQLMINDTPEHAKLRKKSESELDCGPVIRELGEELLDEVAEAELINPQSPYAKATLMRPDNDSPSPLNMDRPHSSSSLASHNYDYSNQSIDDVLNVAAGSGKFAAVSGSDFTANADHGSSVIQSVNADGSQIVYHVTEVPDTHPRDTAAEAPNYNEDNVLTTPLVRQQMARSQQLKQKNKQRRKQSVTLTRNSAGGGVDTLLMATKMQRTAQPHKLSSKAGSHEHIQIKSEHAEIDPMMFLNVYPNSRDITPDPQLISPNLNEDARQSSVSTASGGTGMGRTIGSNTPTPTGDSSILETANDFYNQEEFIADNMPADIFEDASLMGGDNSNLSDNLNQEQYRRNAATGGKISTYIGSNVTSANGASTSAAAAAAVAAGSGAVPVANPVASTSANAAKRAQTVSQGKSASNSNNNSNSNVMAVTKYKSVPINDEIMRDEVNGHLDNVHDELESLKDLLRSDGYSLDANTLLGYGTSATAHNNINRFYLSPTLDGEFLNKLFNDSEVLGPYGLHLTNEASNDKKGCELMAYQPLYDLSDIMDMNENAELDDTDTNMADAAANVSRTGSGLNTPTSGSRSMLNTPYHE